MQLRFTIKDAIDKNEAEIEVVPDQNGFFINYGFPGKPKRSIAVVLGRGNLSFAGLDGDGHVTKRPDAVFNLEG